MMPEDRGSLPTSAQQPSPNPLPPKTSQRPAQAYERPQPGQWHELAGAKKPKSALLRWAGLGAGLLALAAVIVLVVIPLFNRSTRTEADPFAVSRDAMSAPVITNPTLAAPGSSTAPANGAAAPAKSATTRVVGKGDFTKIDAIHYARGTAILGVGNDGKKVLHFENFTSAQGPDLKVYLGTRPDGSQPKEGGLNLGSLPATDGSYNIALPDDLDLAKYKSVVIWCEAFSVTFSVASLA